MRRDIKTGFPFDEVARKDYRNVERELRVLWRLLRVKAKAYGFGWNTLEPIKTNGKMAARYLAKYLGKAQTSEFRVGEERARLFGVWGRKRFVRQRFSWTSSRVFRQRLSWYARDSGIEDVTDFSRLMGRNGWLKLGEPLLNVIMPVEYYQVWDWNACAYRWDERGWRAYCADLEKFPECSTDEERVRRSRLEFYIADGEACGYDAMRALRYAEKRLRREFGEQRPLPFAMRAPIRSAASD
jgi:hypothetical protein